MNDHLACDLVAELAETNATISRIGEWIIHVESMKGVVAYSLAKQVSNAQLVEAKARRTELKRMIADLKHEE